MELRNTVRHRLKTLELHRSDKSVNWPCLDKIAFLLLIAAVPTISHYARVFDRRPGPSR